MSWGSWGWAAKSLRQAASPRSTAVCPASAMYRCFTPTWRASRMRWLLGNSLMSRSFATTWVGSATATSLILTVGSEIEGSCIIKPEYFHSDLPDGFGPPCRRECTRKGFVMSLEYPFQFLGRLWSYLRHVG